VFPARYEMSLFRVNVDIKRDNTAIHRINTHRLSAARGKSLKQKISYSKNIYIFSQGSTALVGPGLHYEIARSHSDTSYSVGLLSTSDRPAVQTSTIQCITITRGRHHYQGWSSRLDVGRQANNPPL